MNASVSQINDYRRRFGVIQNCAAGCGRLAVYGAYCEDCYEQTQVRGSESEGDDLLLWKAPPVQEGTGYGRFALAVVRRFEWVGSLMFVACGLAVIAYEERHFFFECAMGLKDVLGWGK